MRSEQAAWMSEALWAGIRAQASRAAPVPRTRQVTANQRRAACLAWESGTRNFIRCYADIMRKDGHGPQSAPAAAPDHARTGAASRPGDAAHRSP
ncbi:hypothetical protein CBM2592_A20002 [Cupriavidus taiwanensis]|nr:hypothetical protein CBM2592_A20002 [Cupriavidus taiwanensis]SOY82296.1 hypothetical protein CBM2591_A20002 [Cupriavidus taiwanensis]SOZ56094.1 hypothetical protein CBM2617_A20055 [Cupriavidus taiwanensis]SOZ78961.1 hypothetical protein CBM2618_A20054 [Cupriavidus taiwanensis]SOZ79666.1 hypothetical protein CBM2622_A20054 [Cupriavidus taiwanensis]